MNVQVWIFLYFDIELYSRHSRSWQQNFGSRHLSVSLTRIEPSLARFSQERSTVLSNIERGLVYFKIGYMHDPAF